VSTNEEGRAGIREFEADTCKELASSTALLISLMLRPTGAASVPSLPEVTAAKPKAASVAQSTAHDREPRTAPAADSPWSDEDSRQTRPSPPTRVFHLLAGPAVAGSVGVLPGISPGVGALLGVRLNATRLLLSAFFSPNKRGRAEADSAAQGEFRLLSLGASACHELGSGTPAWGLCASSDWQRLTGEGISQSDVLLSARHTADFFTLGGGALVSICVRKWLCLPMRLEALLPTRRPAFTFAAAGVVQRPATVSGRFVIFAEFSVL